MKNLKRWCALVLIAFTGAWMAYHWQRELAPVPPPTESTPLEVTTAVAIAPAPIPVTPTPPPPIILHSGNAALDRFVNKQTGETRLTADFTSLVPRLDDPREIEAVVQVMSDWNDDDTVRNEAIDLLRRSNYSELDRRLIALLDRPFERERIRAFFVQHLGIGLINATAVTEHATRQRLVSALEDRDLAVRREALSALVEVRDRDGLARLERGLDAPELAAMQDLTIYLYHRLDDRRHLDAIRKRAYDPNQMVRISAVYVLGEWNDQASRPALSAAAMSNIHALRRAGELALGKLTSPIPTASF